MREKSGDGLILCNPLRFLRADSRSENSKVFFKLDTILAFKPFSSKTREEFDLNRKVNSSWVGTRRRRETSLTVGRSPSADQVGAPASPIAKLFIFLLLNHSGPVWIDNRMAWPAVIPRYGESPPWITSVIAKFDSSFSHPSLASTQLYQKLSDMNLWFCFVEHKYDFFYHPICNKIL